MVSFPFLWIWEDLSFPPPRHTLPSRPDGIVVFLRHSSLQNNWENSFCCQILLLNKETLKSRRVITQLKHSADVFLVSTSTAPVYAVKYCLFNKKFSSFRYRYLIFGSAEFIPPLWVTKHLIPILIWDKTTNERALYGIMLYGEEVMQKLAD